MFDFRNINPSLGPCPKCGAVIYTYGLPLPGQFEPANGAYDDRERDHLKCTECDWEAINGGPAQLTIQQGGPIARFFAAIKRFWRAPASHNRYEGWGDFPDNIRGRELDKIEMQMVEAKAAGKSRGEFFEEFWRETRRVNGRGI